MDIMSDDELLGVIGHEVGHVAKKHSKKAFKQSLLTSALKDAVASTGNVAAALKRVEAFCIGAVGISHRVVLVHPVDIFLHILSHLLVSLYGAFEEYSHIQTYLEENGFEIVSSEFERIPNDLKDVTPEQRESINKLLEKLEDDEDVQNVFHNMRDED